MANVMKQLLLLDAKNYDEDMDKFVRTAVRGIIFVGNKLLLIEDNKGEVKLPGGGQESGECDADTLIREVMEETGAPYKSAVPGVMHACGHDCHVAMMLTAACILNDVRDELCGEVRLAFQPAEELVEGAAAMVKEGALKDADGCFAIHVWSDVPAGKIWCSSGSQMASSDHFIIDIFVTVCTCFFQTSSNTNND